MADSQEQVADKIRWVVMGALFSLFMMLVVAGVAFLATVRPIDKTIVPRVVGISLSEAMLMLQNSDLSAEITTQFVEDPAYEAGMVLQQNPVAGTYTTVGNAVRLRVSSGLALTKIEDFIGMKLEDARMTIMSRYNGLLTIGEPLMYLVSQEPEGTIIGQEPKAGSALTTPTAISLVVSRGPIQTSQIITAYEGMALDRALTLASQNNLPFVFRVEGEGATGYPVVISQEPAAGSDLSMADAVYFTLQPVLDNDEMVLGLHEINVPAYGNPINIELVVLLEDGREEVLFSTYQQGVRLVAPYYQARGNELIVRANGQEQGRFIVQ